MNKRNKILLSITGIILILLIVLGVAYAYYRTRVIGNENETSISVTSKKLILRYDDGSDGVLTFDNVLPGTELGTKTFTVTNDGDDVVENYHIFLEHVLNGLVANEALVYTLTCKKSDGTACENQITGVDENNIPTTVFPNKNGSILTNTIATKDTHTYVLKLYFKNLITADQTDDMGKILSAKINITDNENIENTETFFNLGNYIMNDDRIAKNSEIPSFTDIESAEVGMYSAEDDYGTSWYFRGAQSYNYVNFAGFTWRVVRINGDGSIRLILDGALDSVIREGETDYAGSRSPFNNPYGGNAYVGYMFGKPNGETYVETHQNLNDSTVKQEVDKFYTNYIENDTKNYHYGEYLADTMFCGDKSLANANTSDDNTALGYGMYKTYYGAINRIFYLIKGSSLTELNPTLKCAEGAEDTYSRYTVDVQTTSKGVSTNSDLTYPIGLLSADEVIFAGGYTSSATNRYYLTDARYNSPDTLTEDWWTMTPGSASSDDTSDSGFDPENYNNCNTEKTVCYTSNTLYIQIGNGRLTSNDNNKNFAVRPVINLKSSVEIVQGNGTYSNPYKLKEI